MTELTKGKWTTVFMRREVKEILRNYKRAHGFKSFGEALLDALSLAYRYRELAKLVVQKEMGEKHE